MKYLYCSVIFDATYHKEKIRARKLALLLTIPCAIFPILMACFGMMQPVGEPLFFAYDKLLFSIVYFVYLAGLYLSWHSHRSLLPFLVFLVHVVSLLLLHEVPEYDWLAYIVLLSIIFTSLTNQYYRVGSMACDEECVAEVIGK